MPRIACFLVFLLLSLPAFAQSRTGPVRVVDGDTLAMSGQRIRLHGINAPESSQQCDNGRWSCGAAATAALVDLVGGQPVACQGRDTDPYGRTVAVCRNAAGVDLSRAMVDQGLATAYRRYSMDYVPAETAARQARLGVWSGQFQDPETYRHGAVVPRAGAAVGGVLAKARRLAGQLVAAGAAAPDTSGAFPREGHGYNQFDGSGGWQPAQASPGLDPAPQLDSGTQALLAPSAATASQACALVQMLGRACSAPNP